MKVMICNIESEHRQVDHLVVNESDTTLCGKPWDVKTRREWLKKEHGTDERPDSVDCYRCREIAKARIVRSLEAAHTLTQWAGLDWKEMHDRARVPVYDLRRADLFRGRG